MKNKTEKLKIQDGGRCEGNQSVTTWHRLVESTKKILHMCHALSQSGKRFQYPSVTFLGLSLLELDEIMCVSF